MNRITLHGGPYHGRAIIDSGVVTIRMSLTHRSHAEGSPCGYAYYEPDERREAAFWRENVWPGETLVSVDD